VRRGLCLARWSVEAFGKNQIAIGIHHGDAYFRVGFKGFLLGCRHHFLRGGKINRLWF